MLPESTRKRRKRNFMEPLRLRQKVFRVSVFLFPGKILVSRFMIHPKSIKSNPESSLFANPLKPISGSRQITGRRQERKIRAPVSPAI
jgi:hypothetical protein